MIFGQIFINALGFSGFTQLCVTLCNKELLFWNGIGFGIGIGTADKVQSIEMHQRYFDAAEPHDNITVRIFDGADHGYTWPVSPNYHEEAATVGWTETTARFERILG